MKFADILLFPTCHYVVDISWESLEDHIARHKRQYGLNLNPDFQRAHVWTQSQQVQYCEYILRGGSSGRDLYFNHPSWMKTFDGEYVIVDGKQRLQAVRCFLNNEIPVFGAYFKEYEDKMRMTVASFRWNIAMLKTRKEVLEWYLAFNAGGSVHTQEELDTVRRLLEEA